MTFQARFILSEPELQQFGKALSGALKAGDCITLQGTLGAGKTTLARAIIHALTGETDIPSPTFTILHPYDAPSFHISHYDLYRIENPNDLQELAIDEALIRGVCLIEWPEIALSLLPTSRLSLRLQVAEDETRRTLEIEGHAEWHHRWQQWNLPR